jgi:WD40 repeat protein
MIGGGIWFTLQLRQERDLANRGRYAADMNLARRALDDGLIYQVREQLETYRTGPKALGDLRGFEWYYLAHLCDPELIRLRGHEKVVFCLAFHPDGQRVISGGADGTVRIWDLTAPRAPHVLAGDGGTVFSVAVSPDGHWLAAGDAASGIRLWELETGQERTLRGHERELKSVAFSPDSRHLLSIDAGGLIVQWDVRSGGVDFDLRDRPDDNQTGHGVMAAYSPDGRTIISAAGDEWVRIWDVAARRVRDRVRGASSQAFFSISPDGRQLAVAGEYAVEILDLERLDHPRRALQRRGYTAKLGSTAFSPDWQMLALSGAGGEVRLFDARRGRILDVFVEQANRSSSSLVFGAGARLLAMAVGNEVHVAHLARRPDGVTLASGLGPVDRLALSPGERLLALGRDDGTIVIWDVRAGRALQILGGHGLAVFGLAFVPRTHGAWLVSVGGDGRIHVWDPDARGQPLRAFSGRARAVYAVAARSDGRQIAAGGDDGSVLTWDPATGRPDLTALDHGGPVTALAYDPTGTALASGSMDRTVRVWSARSGGRRLGPLEHPHPVTSLAFSPDGRLLAAGGGAPDKGGRVLIWDASSGTVSATVDCPRGVDSLSFSPDSRRIATCGADAVVQVWDATGGHETLSLSGHRDRVTAVLFAPRAMRLYSTGRDGVVKFWDGSAAAPAE